MRFVLALVSAGLASLVSATYSISDRTGSLPYFLTLQNGNRTVVINDGVYAGDHKTSTIALSVDGTGAITNNGTSGTVGSGMLTPSIARIEVNTSSAFTGAKFAIANGEKLFGIWSYPFGGSIANGNTTFDLKGVGNSEGINWNNARAPFFMSTYGYGVYVDNQAMSTYDLSQPNHAQFIFNASSLVYYVILPQGTPYNFKSILAQYMQLSSKIEMPPDSAYGPTFWSDDFEQDFHGDVKDAEENIYDIVAHLKTSQIHASAIFDDRPYGTGNSSFGNFDFDPKFYPDPARLLQNLTDSGYDFQVWAANRAFYETEMYKVGTEKNWFFPGIDPVRFQGPAFDLTIPEAYAWTKEKLRYFTSIGVKGFKIDRGEEGEMPVYAQNVQMTLYLKLLHEVMAEKWGKGKFYNFARSVVDRGRSYTGVWNGDSHADWTGLRYTVASGIRAGLLGFSMWGSDTGGYNRSPTYNLTSELWARWMWFSTFSPAYEIMVGTGNTPWYAPHNASILSNDTNLMDILKQTTKLHHELRPFIKSHTYGATQDGIPLIRAMMLETPTDKASYEISDQFFFGNEFLVAPIVNACGERKVYFPGAGLKYVDYFNHSRVYTGGSTVDIKVALNEAPIYVPAGSIIPKGDTYLGNNRWTKDWKPSLEIEFYPSYDVPVSNFKYWNGEKEVRIQMTTFKVEDGISVAYEDLAMDGTLVLITAAGRLNATIRPGGGAVNFEGVKTIFESSR